MSTVRHATVRAFAQVRAVSLCCAWAGVLLASVVGCGKSSTFGPQTKFEIISGSENEALEPLLKRFAAEKGVELKMSYKGSVDIMLELEQGRAMPYDAVWPAHSLWIDLGDSQKVVKNEESVMHSPVVFGVKRSVAEKLGWIGRDVTVADILKAADAGQFTFSMTSATQSNSGASAYLGFLHALADAPDVLTSSHLADPKLQDKTARLLKRVDRSSGSSGWLKQTVVANYDQVQAMVNYESMIIEANHELIAQGKEPLVAIYPVDGMTIADSPLGFVDHGDPAKETFYREMLVYLKSDPIQKEIMGLGRRAGVVGFDARSADPAVFNPDWGIDVTRVIAPVPLPSELVLREALDLFQAGGVRKPSATVYVLDCSGSMNGKGIEQLKEAMSLLLDPKKSKRFMLQPSARDLHIVVPFDAQPREVLKTTGNKPEDLHKLLDHILALNAQGGTNVYSATVEALRDLEKVAALDDYFPAVILMTDGKSDGELAAIRAEMQKRHGRAIPVYCITFGDADDRQLKQISELTGGRVFNGQKDLAKAFRDAKGYN